MWLQGRLLVLLAICAGINDVSTDVFTSMNRIKEMVMNEVNILNNINRLTPEMRVGKLHELYNDKLQEFKTKNLTEEVRKLNHPNGAYSTIQKFATDYKVLHNSLRKLHLEPTVRGYLSELADDDDIRGARLSILRLQEVYNLEVHDMVKGKYLNHSGPALNSTDAYLIGQAAFMDGMVAKSAQWLQEALVLRSEEEQIEAEKQYEDDVSLFGKVERKEAPGKETSVASIKALLGRSFLRLGKLEQARKIYRDTKSEEAYEGDVQALSMELKKKVPERVEEKKDSNLEDFHRLCALQEKTRETFNEPRLRCRYRKVFVPYFRFNEEIVSNTPYVSVFYDVISDSHAETVKRKTIHKLFRGVVVSETGQTTSTVRTSHVAFLEDTESPVVKFISQRISYLTNLDTKPSPTGFHTPSQSSSEPLQVVNYGLGGHYTVHLDPYEHRNDDTKKVLDYSGNRLSTFLIYLTDVERGGSTAFPLADIVVSPKKRSAVFWYSFTPSGKLDQATLHAGCPVVVGEKWIINKWILSYGNTFNRRCGLKKKSTQLDIDEDMRNGWRPKLKKKQKRRYTGCNAPPTPASSWASLFTS